MFWQENAVENVVCRIAAILFKPACLMSQIAVTEQLCASLNTVLTYYYLVILYGDQIGVSNGSGNGLLLEDIHLRAILKELSMNLIHDVLWDHTLLLHLPGVN